MSEEQRRVWSVTGVPVSGWALQYHLFKPVNTTGLSSEGTCVLCGFQKCMYFWAYKNISDLRIVCPPHPLFWKAVKVFISEKPLRPDLKFAIHWVGSLGLEGHSGDLSLGSYLWNWLCPSIHSISLGLPPADPVVALPKVGKPRWVVHVLPCPP